MSVSFNDFSRNPEELIQSELSAVTDVIRSGWWILGQKLQEFEAAWAATCGVSGCVGVGNGLDAIEIGLKCLGIGPGDEVITTAVTAYATTLAIARSGATPVFADIDPNTACLCPSSVELCITKKTKAVVVVHLYGRSADICSLKELCDINNIHLVEDCAQAHLARSHAHPVGSFGTFAAWSFYPTKNLGAIGDAGAITSSDPDLLDKARKFRNYGQKDRYQHDTEGMNSRLDELQAAILLQRLPYLSTWTARRRQIAERYHAEISHPSLQLLSRADNPDNHVYHLFVVTTDNRHTVQEQLLAQGIQTLIHYPIPCHRQKALGPHLLSPGGLLATEAHCQTCLSLPIHPYLSENEVDCIVASCNNLDA